MNIKVLLNNNKFGDLTSVFSQIIIDSQSWLWELTVNFFPGDKPCSQNKYENKKCDVSNYYPPIKSKILIIKLRKIVKFFEPLHF
jgi:hypothetical protein